MGVRVDFPLFLNQYVGERRFRVLASNLSETGIFLNRVEAGRRCQRTVCGIEIALPGTADTIWARGEISRQRPDQLVRGLGIRFSGIARADAQLLRSWCLEARRNQLAGLLQRIRRPSA